MAKLRVKFKKDSLIRYISHLDLMRLFQRAFRRANIPVEYSQGYNPQPKFSLATALALGLTSEGEYMDIEVVEEISTEEFTRKMNEVLPEGVKILKANYTEDSKSLMALIKWSSYIIELELLEGTSKEKVLENISDYLKQDEILITKQKKKKGRIVTREVNIREGIENIELLLLEENKLILKTLLKTGSNGNLKPEILIETLHREGLNINNEEYKIHRLELFTEIDGKKVAPI
ncbi:TIGR03936 family radical SAM-associated protein [Clostridium sp. D2Q-11]|uniref:TIGR03936 family radical SAM-associated protein n=1 Tax=Anaeromonas frigoriresistens TaxID=2683708 RepID=A0A942UZ76_9FIRM|nr:TIGR03936 family radical SAM-associated protein [Anaeromonas frigoriresistens]MBS4537167.1 TIGR03936 family radical SAM-associated protein [Anaeromonas frigoriresistens]